MPKYFVTRRDWEVGPIFEVQFQQMIDQRWFRPGDLVRVGDGSAWLPAERVVPLVGFGGDEVSSEVAEDEEDEELEHRPPPVLTPFMVEEQQKADAVPVWFRSRRSSGTRSSVRNNSETDNSLRDMSPHKVEWLPDDAGDEEENRPATDTSDSADAFRFQTAEFQVPDGYEPVLPEDELSVEAEDHQPVNRRDISNDDGSLRHRKRPANHDEEDSSRDVLRRKKRSPSRDEEPPAKPLPSTHPASAHSNELLLPDAFELDADPDREAELLGTTGREAPELPPSVRRPPARSVFDADEDEVADLLPKEPSRSKCPSGEIDFSKLANLAEDDPRISRSELPTYAAPPPLLTPEERVLRGMATVGRFQDALGWLFLSLGVHSCLISTVVNGLAYAAFKRLFVLSMEVFIPFEGSSEALAEENLALAGTAMACSIALPFLPLAYLIKIDGRVIEYGVTLVAAMFAAAFINGTDGGPVATSLTLLFLALPAGVTVILSGVVTALADDPKARILTVASAALAGATTAMVVFAAPSFGINNDLRAFPPAMSVGSPHGYGVLLLYGLQLVPIYLLLQRLARMLLDRATQEMVQEHFVFHGFLTCGGLAIFAMVHLEAITGWFAIPAIVASLITLVASGFNLWSLVTHYLPQLDRLRRERDRFAA